MPVRKQDWTRPLREPIDVGGGRRKLRTLHDVRAHILGLSEAQQQLRGWQNVARAILEAAETGDVSGISAAVWLARQLDRIRK